MEQQFNQINLKDSIGKSIKSVFTEREKFLMIFTDNTFVYFAKYQEWDDYDHLSDIKVTYEKFKEKLNIRSDGSTWLSGTAKLFVKAGLLNEEQLIKDCQNKIDEFVKKQKERDFKEYERLSKVFNK